MLNERTYGVIMRLYQLAQANREQKGTLSSEGLSRGIPGQEGSVQEYFSGAQVRLGSGARIWIKYRLPSFSLA